MRRHLRRLKRSLLLRDIGIIIAAGFFLVSGAVLLWASTLRIPDLNSFSERRVTQSAKIYDRTGEILLYDLGGDAKRTIVDDSAISRNIKNAAVAIEDAEFYEHRGIKPTAILRAVLANVLIKLNLSGGYTQGGSTITQQVVKNSILTTEKSISRKLKEWVLALKIERILSKEQILNIYLNESPYGGTLYGIEEASLAFFGKHAADLSVAEAAYLAAIPQAPTYYSPYGNHRDRLEARKNLVLDKMLENGFVTREEFDSAKTETVIFLPQGDTSIKAPHFVFFVREYLESKYGDQAIQTEGLKVITTLDFPLQARAEELAKQYADDNQKNFNASNLALTAVDPKTGQILVMVGSRDYFSETIDGNFNAALGFRQPGSAFKPFVYATAFGKGYTPDTVVFDLKTQFSTSCGPNDFSKESPCFSPDNYDEVFRGPISLRNALAQSINIPAVKTLYLAGITDSIRTARDMGISTLEGADRYGLTLVLGGGEVTLLDITSAYGTFANDGIRNPYVSVLKIENAEGIILEEYRPTSRQAILPNVARLISDVLSDNDARAPAFGERSALYIPGRDIAVKTGTTNDYRDAWIVGYTPSLAVGAWAGNNDNSQMEKKVAGFIVAPFWNAFMSEALQKFPEESFPEPDTTDVRSVRPILRGLWQGGKVYVVDKFSGGLATEFTPPEARIEKAVKNIHTILYWVDKDEPNGPAPENPQNDPQFERWEYPVRTWVSEVGIVEESDAVMPTFSDTIHTGAIPKVNISGITQGATYAATARITVGVSLSGLYPISKAEFYLNGQFIGSAERAPYSISFIPNASEGIGLRNTLRVVGYDSVFNKGEVNVEFKLSGLE